MFLSKCRIFKFDLFSNLRNMSSTKCYLINLKTHKKIPVINSTEVFLGRNKLSEVTDTLVSKQQILCCVNLNEKKIKVKVVGNAVSGHNGLALQKYGMYDIGNEDIIELRLGYHKFRVQFDDEENKPKKPKLDTSNTVWHTLMFPSTSTSSVQNKIDKISTPQCIQSNSTDVEQRTPIWEEIDNKELLICTPAGCMGKSKIAGFDIDGTIIKTKSGQRFPKDINDWTWNIGDIKSQLNKLHERDYKIVFFTNQSGVGKDISKISEYKQKIERILNALKLPVQIFVSLGHLIYRKPRTGMWDVLIKEKNSSVVVDMKESFYVGDAAGRPKHWSLKKPKDHSLCDRLFALNIGLKFFTPEEYFCKQTPAKFIMPEFDPRNISTVNLQYPDLAYNKQNVILMVGGPASGKSHFVKHHLIPMNYHRINRDELGSWQKCIKLMEEAIHEKKNIVIDNVNVDKVTREKFIETAHKYNVDVRCFIMDTSVTQMRHNNKFRELTDRSHAIITDIIIYSYNKKFEPPTTDEGYKQILKIPFIINFTDESHEKLYKSFLLD